MIFISISFGIFLIKVYYLSKRYKLVLFLFFLINIGVFYFTNTENVKRLILEGPSYISNLRLTGKFGLKVIPGGRFSKPIENAAIWTMKNIPKNSKLHIGGNYDHAIKFYTNGEYQYFGRNNPRYYNVSEKSKLLTHGLVRNQQEKNLQENQHNRIIQLITTKKFSTIGEQFRYRSQLFMLYYKDLEEFLLELTKEKKYVFKFQGEKVVFPIVETAIEHVTQKIYSKKGVTILESLPSDYDFNVIIEKIDSELLARGNTPELSWLNVERDLRWLKKNYPNEFNQYYNFLLSEGVDLPEIFQH